MNKSQIRKKFQNIRKQISKQGVEKKSLNICENVISNLINKIPNFFDKKLAFYIAANNEVNPSYLVRFCQQQGSTISMPRISLDGKNLLFKEYKMTDELEVNDLYKNLLEPLSDKNDIEPEIIFVPLVVFDTNCNRIGMGGGFYDRTIANIRNYNQNAIFIGLGYDKQLYSNILTDENDQALDFIVCESNIYSF